MKKFFALIILLTLLPSQASALSCVQPDQSLILSPGENIKTHDYVFIGTVSSVDEAGENYDKPNIHNIDVEQWIRGESQKPVQILTDSTWGGIYEKGSTGIFLFNEDEQANPEYNRSYDASKLQFQTDLCGDGNSQVIISSYIEYAEYSSAVIDPDNSVIKTLVNGTFYEFSTVQDAYDEFVQYETDNNLTYPETKDLRQTDWGYEGSSTKLNRFYDWFEENKAGKMPEVEDNNNETNEEESLVTTTNLLIALIPVAIAALTLAYLLKRIKNKI